MVLNPCITATGALAGPPPAGARRDSEEQVVRTRTRTRRIARRALLVAASVVACLLSGAVPAAAAPAPTPAPSQSASISGPGIRGTMSFTKSKDPAQYNQLVSMTSWMDGQPGNIIATTPSNIGPEYTVKLTTGK